MNKLRYLVPNACTSLSLLLGLASVLQSIDGQYELAAWMILWGVLLDKLDGTTARLLNASSKIGAELDSFADFVSFGIAPGFLIYMSQAHNPMVHHGWLVASCGIFIVAVAVRLARFNVSEPPGSDRLFYGVPTTLMGAMLGSGVLTFLKYQFPEEWMAFVPFLMLIGAFAMISSLRIPKLKLRKSLPLNIFQGSNVLFAYIFAPLKMFPQVLFIQAVSYLIIGAVWCFLGFGEQGDELIEGVEEDIFESGNGDVTLS
ncbi:MAG: hypothetical protein CMK59_10830 [Proteobacteria bacterium]|nr:hypothetical protein [Pseudomonadota bacterium]